VAAAWVALAGATGMAIGSFLPWSRSGTVERTSYQLVAAAERLEVLGPRLQAVAVAWYFLLAGVGAAWLAAALHRIRIAAGLCAGSGLLALLFSGATMRSPLPSLVGAQLTAASSVVALVGSIAAIGISLRRGAGGDEERA
jgi:hypothetical protein